MDVYSIIEQPIVSERTALMKQQANKYVFRVRRDANKHEIRQAIEELFKVSVRKVHTVIMPGKKRRMGKFEGHRPDWKKAIVTLTAGQEISVVEEQA